MTDQLDALEALLPDLPAAADRRRLGDRLVQAIQDLKEAPSQARRLKALISLAETVGFGASPDQRAMIGELRETAREVGAALEEADDEEGLKSAVYDYQKSLLPALATFDRGAREQWSSVVRDRFAPLIAFGELLEKIDNVADLGRSLADCGRRAQRLTSGSAEDLLSNVTSLLAERDALQTERGEKIGDDDVGEFLNALAVGRATLDLITPDVRAWLDQNQALGRFRVSAA
jgi:hypothetical protein